MKAKTLIGFAMMMVALFISAAPALAQFTGTSGKGEAAEPGTFEGGGGKVKCASAKSEAIKVTATEANLGATKWNKCTTEVGIFKLEATVTCNGLTLEQPNKEGTENGKATGKNTEACIIKAVGCEITVPVAENQKLGKTALKKEGTKEIINAVVETTGITQKVNKTCESDGIKNTKEATLKVPKLKAEPFGLA